MIAFGQSGGVGRRGRVVRDCWASSDVDSICSRAVSILHESATDNAPPERHRTRARLASTAAPTQCLAAPLAQAGTLGPGPHDEQISPGPGPDRVVTMPQSHALPRWSCPTSATWPTWSANSTHPGALDGSSGPQAVDVATARSIHFGGWTGRRTPRHCTPPARPCWPTRPAARTVGPGRPRSPSFHPHTITDDTMLQEELVESAAAVTPSSSGDYLDGVLPVAAPLLSRMNRHGSDHGGRQREPVHQSQDPECSEDLPAVGREVSAPRPEPHRLGRTLPGGTVRRHGIPDCASQWYSCIGLFRRVSQLTAKATSDAPARAIFCMRILASGPCAERAPRAVGLERGPFPRSIRCRLRIVHHDCIICIALLCGGNQYLMVIPA